MTVTACPRCGRTAAVRCASCGVERDLGPASSDAVIDAAVRGERALIADRLRRDEPPFGVCACGAEMDEHGCPHGH